MPFTHDKVCITQILMVDYMRLSIGIGTRRSHRGQINLRRCTSQPRIGYAWPVEIWSCQAFAIEGTLSVGSVNQRELSLRHNNGQLLQYDLRLSYQSFCDSLSFSPHTGHTIITFHFSIVQESMTCIESHKNHEGWAGRDCLK